LTRVKAIFIGILNKLISRLASESLELLNQEETVSMEMDLDSLVTTSLSWFIPN
jgi:hypothetical protein